MQSVTSIGNLRALAGAALLILGSGSAAMAEDAKFSQTDFQYSYGRILNPFTKTDTNTSIITLQHSSTSSFGDLYFFIDFLDDGRRDGFNDKDAYGELYLALSSRKILGIQYGSVIKDVGFVGGINADTDVDYLSWLAGFYVDWGMPGFAFSRTRFSAIVDSSSGALAQENGWQADWSWAAPFQIGQQKFSFEGHIEYTSYGDFHNGGKQLDWVLAQPQLMWDVGHAVGGKSGAFYLGVEYQYWHNKLGVKGTENIPQAQATLRF